MWVEPSAPMRWHRGDGLCVLSGGAVAEIAGGRTSRLGWYGAGDQILMP